jgi:hypothetical protein
MRQKCRRGRAAKWVPAEGRRLVGLVTAAVRHVADRFDVDVAIAAHRQRPARCVPSGAGATPNWTARAGIDWLSSTYAVTRRGVPNVEHANAIHIIQGQFSSTPHRPANAIRATTDIARQRRQEIIGHGGSAVSRTADCDIAVAWVTDGVVQTVSPGILRADSPWIADTRSAPHASSLPPWRCRLAFAQSALTAGWSACAS